MTRPDPFDLTGKRVLVTGAASGIGFATCARIAAMGAQVLAYDRDEEGLSALLASLSGSGHVGQAIDLSLIDRIPEAMAHSVAQGGRLNGLVHAAGISSISPTRLLTPNNYREVFTLNAEAALGLLRGFQNRMVSDVNGGSLVLVSSVMALVGSVGATAYSMSKAALLGLVKSAALEFAPRRIRINCVAPGFVKTPMFNKVSAHWSAEQAQQVEQAHPLGLGDPEDVANAIAFLLSDASRWVTGSTLVCDGGYTAS